MDDLFSNVCKIINTIASDVPDTDDVTDTDLTIHEVRKQLRARKLPATGTDQEVFYRFWALMQPEIDAHNKALEEEEGSSDSDSSEGNSGAGGEGSDDEAPSTSTNDKTTLTCGSSELSLSPTVSNQTTSSSSPSPFSSTTSSPSVGGFSSPDLGISSPPARAEAYDYDSFAERTRTLNMPTFGSLSLAGKSSAAVDGVDGPPQTTRAFAAAEGGMTSSFLPFSGIGESFNFNTRDSGSNQGRQFFFDLEGTPRSTFSRRDAAVESSLTVTVAGKKMSSSESRKPIAESTFDNVLGAPPPPPPAKKMVRLGEGGKLKVHIQQPVAVVAPLAPLYQLKNADIVGKRTVALARPRAPAPAAPPAAVKEVVKVKGPVVAAAASSSFKASFTPILKRSALGEALGNTKMNVVKGNEGAGAGLGRPRVGVIKAHQPPQREKLQIPASEQTPAELRKRRAERFVGELEEEPGLVMINSKEEALQLKIALAMKRDRLNEIRQKKATTATPSVPKGMQLQQQQQQQPISRPKMIRLTPTKAFGIESSSTNNNNPSATASAGEMKTDAELKKDRAARFAQEL